MLYTISPTNIQLKSSFEVREGDFERELTAIRELHLDCLVSNRSMRSLKREWAAHNAFHALRFLRRQTADTDLNWPQPWYFRLGYAIIGTLVWPFIKQCYPRISLIISVLHFCLCSKKDTDLSLMDYGPTFCVAGGASCKTAFRLLHL